MSPFACDIIIGLLNRDHRRRYDLKDIEKHHWVKHGAQTEDSLNELDTDNPIERSSLTV